MKTKHVLMWVIWIAAAIGSMGLLANLAESKPAEQIYINVPADQPIWLSLRVCGASSAMLVVMPDRTLHFITDHDSPLWSQLPKPVSPDVPVIELPTDACGVTT